MLSEGVCVDVCVCVAHLMRRVGIGSLRSNAPIPLFAEQVYRSAYLAFQAARIKWCVGLLVCGRGTARGDAVHRTPTTHQEITASSTRGLQHPAFTCTSTRTTSFLAWL